QIPFQSSERNDVHPLILGGGASVFNPEPVAEFFDALLLGDGEEAIIEIVQIVRQAKLTGLRKKELLYLLSEIHGLYVPQHYSPEYDDKGRITAITNTPGTPVSVPRRIVSNLNGIDHLKRPLVPNAKIIHDRLGIEIARGCTRGCRFCQAGITYRPVRERSVGQIIELAEEGIENSGFEELALLSLSTGDYSCLPELLPLLMNRFTDEFVSVAMPSMRVGTLTQELMDEIKRVRKTGFTLAPEAGSERLRKAINKGISEEDLLSTTGNAFALGWNLIKLYFMIGLPTETMEDIDAIVELAKKTASAGDVSGCGRKKVTISVGTFIPKPHTPFQWEEQISMAKSHERINHLRASLPQRGFNFKWHAPEQSFLEGVFSRGDRRLSKLIRVAWQNGARLDSWSDYFNLDRWLNAAEQCNLDLNFYLRRRQHNEVLPWQHLKSGVERDFLLEELKKTHNGEYTPDCRYHKCQQCGLCDFETIYPIVHNKNQLAPPAGKKDYPNQKKVDSASVEHFTYLVTYTRIGKICYLGHLEFLQIIFRALRRAKIKTNFSQGYNPSPKVSFGPALPVGTESLCEHFLVDLPRPINDYSRTTARLNDALPKGITVLEIQAHGKRLPQEIVSTYEIATPFQLSRREKSALAEFLTLPQFTVERIRKGKRKQIDIRPLISAITVPAANRITLKIHSKSGAPGIKPTEALRNILQRNEHEMLSCHVMKTAWEEHKN
ncbi:MAG: TIGR03960 family B12-binding radical SAM protein, partial [Desulfobacterales bacterium]|nr:TIGR03960 family B12-binding radical SAM protein [Desulfobacterales bacterium]